LIEAVSAGIGLHQCELLEQVSFLIKPSSICVILGPNGAGKSTLLRTLVGLIPPLNGEIMYQGRNIHRMSDSVRAELISWIPQEESFEFGWKAEEYVGLGRVAHNHTLVETSEDVDAIRSAMELTDCRQLVGRSILEMSGGERQRVRLARAIAQETPVLAMDEPTSHLDIAHQWEFLAKCEVLRQTGKTLVISLHDVNQAISLNAEYLLVSPRSVQHFETSDSLIRSEALTSSFGIHFETLTSADGRTVLVPRTAVSS